MATNCGPTFTMNAVNYINVWEWEVQPCLWVPYEPKMCRFIEDAFRQSKGSINLGNESQELACFEINFAMLKQVNLYTNESIRVRQQQYPCTYPLAKGVLWMWWSDFRWALYDVPTMVHIEDEFQKRSQYLDLSRSPLAIPNVIDFSNMSQTNKNTQKSRKIQRHETSEHYPIAVYQLGRSALRAGAAWPSGLPQQPAYQGMHGRNNGISMPTNGAQRNPLLQVPTGAQSVNLLLNRPGIKVPTQTPGYHYPALQTVAKHHHDNDEEEDDSSSAKKKKANGTSSLGGPLAYFTYPVTVTGRSDDGLIAKQQYQAVLRYNSKYKKECAICLQNLTKPSDYDLTDPGVPTDVQCVSPDILKLNKCKHLFHRICLQKMYNTGTKDGCLQCPTCKTIHGVKRGNQPSNGSMDVQTNMVDIPGYPGYGSIVILYNFQAGVQGEHHPNPGQPYNTNGFPRTCYLPNNAKGQKVLQLLKKAFERQLIFTIGTSVTTGLENTIVWNDIHHKTEGYQNRSGHGYPDPNYLDNILAELASHGITDAEEYFV